MGDYLVIFIFHFEQLLKSILRKKMRALHFVFKTENWLISSCKLARPEESEEEGQITDAEHLALDF